jgi:DNA-binding transcriptional LysR family regulator
MVPGFAGIAALSCAAATMLATAAQRCCARICCADLQSPRRCRVECPPMPMYMVWHARHQVDAAHRWLRAEVEAVVGDVVA